MLVTIIGGVGLFLLGMLLLTDGLKAAAGAALNRILYRFTRLPLLGVLSGALVTALVQSSSATTLATIGFVSAGMLSFPQALGVIYGINLGTTSTAWLVSLIGFKVNVSALALPLIAAGALVRLVGAGRAGAYGLVMAGFGLLFVGIATLQDGMRGVAETLDLARFSAAGWGGILLLVAIGLVMTVVMQSSSAAVATTLTALHAGAIGLEQAAALVIGQNIGTTVKALLAALGASVAARRAAAAHIVFNALTAVLALALLGYFVMGMRYLESRFSWDAATTLAAFHSAFNILGVLVFLPLTGPFARLIMRLVPETGPVLTKHLNPRLIPTAATALEAVRRTGLDIAALLFGVMGDALRQRTVPRIAMRQLDKADEALREARRYLAQVRSASEGGSEYRKHVSVLHALEHLERLEEACREQDHSRHLGREPHLRQCSQALATQLAEARALIGVGAEADLLPLMQEISYQVAATRRQQRVVVLRQAAAGVIDSEQALEVLETMRWVDRLAYHAWRAIHHLQEDPPGDAGAGEVMG